MSHEQQNRSWNDIGEGNLLRVRTAVTPIAFLALVALAATVSSAERAQACTSYERQRIEMPQAPVDPDGTLRISVWCISVDFCASATATLRVLEGGEELAGATQLLRSTTSWVNGRYTAMHVLFKPDAPFVLNQAHHAELSLDDSENTHVMDFTVAETSTPTPVNNLEIQLSYRVRPVGKQFCCGGGTGCFDTCFTAEEQAQALLTASVPETSDAPYLLYRLRPIDNGAAVDGGFHLAAPSSPWITSYADHSVPQPSPPPPGNVWIHSYVEFNQPRSSYCATLEILNTVDGSMQSMDVCKDAVDMDDVGEVRLATYDALEFSSYCPLVPIDYACAGYGGTCEATPARVVDAWCEIHAQDGSGNTLFGGYESKCAAASTSGGCSVGGRPANLSSFTLLGLAALACARPRRSSPR